MDEYDPAKPNEYEDVRKDKERVREVAQQEADRQEELRLLQVSLHAQGKPAFMSYEAYLEARVLDDGRGHLQTGSQLCHMIDHGTRVINTP